jgi:hypothetical protein
MTQDLVHVLRLDDNLLDQVIFALIVRIRDLNARPDLDSELIVQTQAALDLAYEAKDLMKRKESKR